MNLTIQYEIPPRTPTTRTAAVCDLFGLSPAPDRTVLADNLKLPLAAGQVVFFEGDSGSGKSSLLRAACDQLRQAGAIVRSLDDVTFSDKSVIDLFSAPVEETLGWLSACGLGEAALMLRTPSELSDGQRHRLRMALALAERPDWLALDEFTATLDRPLARVIAHSLQKLARRVGVGLLAASTHADVLEDLNPDWRVVCRLGQPARLASVAVDDRGEVKKKVYPSSATCGSPTAPKATGRISRGGIIAATPSV